MSDQAHAAKPQASARKRKCKGNNREVILPPSVLLTGCIEPTKVKGHAGETLMANATKKVVPEAGQTNKLKSDLNFRGRGRTRKLQKKPKNLLVETCLKTC